MRRDISSYAYYVYQNKALCVGKDISAGSRGLFGGCGSSLSVQGTYTSLSPLCTIVRFFCLLSEYCRDDEG